MAVRRWVVVDCPNPSARNRHLLKLNGSREDILALFNKFMDDCEVPFSPKDDKQYNWGLYFYDSNGKVSERIKQELESKIANDLEKEEFDENNKKDEMNNSENKNKKVEITDFFSELTNGDDEKDKKTKEDVEPEARFDDSEVKKINDIIKSEAKEQSEKKPKDKPREENKEEPRTLNKNKVDEPKIEIAREAQPGDNTPVKKQSYKENGDVGLDSLISELNSVLADLTKSERDKIGKTISDDWAETKSHLNQMAEKNDEKADKFEGHRPAFNAELVDRSKESHSLGQKKDEIKAQEFLEGERVLDISGSDFKAPPDSKKESGPVGHDDEKGMEEIRKIISNADVDKKSYASDTAGIRGKPENIPEEVHTVNLNDIRICCIYQKDDDEGLEIFKSNIKEVIEKTTKSKFNAVFSMMSPVDIKSSTIEEIISIICRAPFDLIVMLNVEKDTDEVINQLISKTKDMRINFHVVERSMIKKKFIYVDLVVDLMIKKKQMMG